MKPTVWKLRGGVLATLAGVALFGMGCDPPALPPPEPDRVLTDLTAAEVRGLHQVLRAIKNDTANGSQVTKDITPNGHLVRVIVSLAGALNPCPAVANDAYLESWVCDTTVTGVFKLKRKFSDVTEVDGGNVTLDNDATGDKIKFEEDVKYLWDAPSKQLTVSVRYPADLNLKNHIRTWGLYNMAGLTQTSITTSTSSHSADASFSLPTPFTFGLSASVTKNQLAKTSLVHVIIAGNPYWADRGMFQFKRDYNETFFSLGMDWMTNALADFNENVLQFNATCSGSRSDNVSISGKAESSGINGGTKMSGTVKDGHTETVTCSSKAETLAAHLHFQAANALACGTAVCPGATVGERLRSYIHFENLLNGTCRRNYYAAFTAAVNWQMSLVASNGQDGAGFDLGSSTSVWDQASGTSYSDNYSCDATLGPPTG